MRRGRGVWRSSLDASPCPKPSFRFCGGARRWCLVVFTVFEWLKGQMTDSLYMYVTGYFEQKHYRSVQNPMRIISDYAGPSQNDWCGWRSRRQLKPTVRDERATLTIFSRAGMSSGKKRNLRHRLHHSEQVTLSLISLATLARSVSLRFPSHI